MKAFAIRDASLDKNRDLAWLLYYESERTFYIEIAEDLEEWEAPLILSSFVKKNRLTVDAYWSSVWVEQRIVPRDRQNLGLILKEYHLTEYDPFQLLLLANGRCAQDDCYLVPLKKDALPEPLQRRLQLTLCDVFQIPGRTFFFFRDGMIRSADNRELLALAADSSDAIPFYIRQRRRLTYYQKEIARLKLCAGGHAVSADDRNELSCEELRHTGTPAGTDTSALRAYMQYALVDTHTAAELLHCTRQNIQDLVRRGKLQPVITLRNNFLFLRYDL